MDPWLERMLSDRMSAQHGVLSKVQAVECGATIRQIDRLIARGTWEQIHPGVYRNAASPYGNKARIVASVLSLGPHAAASHDSAAWLWSMVDRPPRGVHVSVPRRIWRPRSFCVHRSTDFDPLFVTHRFEIPTTTAERTLVDLPATAKSWVVEQALDAALRMRLVSIEGMTCLIDDLARQGRRGIRVIRDLVEVRSEWATPAESPLEDEFRRLVASHGLPLPRSQVEIRDADGTLVGRVDFAYPDRRLVIEVDGYAYHSDPASFVRDRRRQNRLQALGYIVLRFTADDLRNRPGTVIRDLSRLVSIDSSQ